MHALAQVLEMHHVCSLAGKPAPPCSREKNGHPPPSLSWEWDVPLHPASSRVPNMSVFPLQGVQEDQPQQQGESMHTETGPCAPSLGVSQPKCRLCWGSFGVALPMA